MQLMMSVLAGVCLLVGGELCCAAQGASPDATAAVCRESLAKPAPEPPRFAHPLAVDALRSCDEQALYYGFSRKPDDNAALQCGWWQRAHPTPSVGDLFRGPGVLAMLYANGRGVPRDADLAVRFACEDEWINDGGQATRLSRLQAMKGGVAPGAKPFDLCDDGTSGLMEGACADVTEGLADGVRAQKLARLRTALRQEARAELPSLEAAERSFEETRIRHEIDIGGTGRAAFVVEDRGRLREQFLINLRSFADGKVPPATPAQRSAVEAEVQRLFAAIEQAPADAWQKQGLVGIDRAGIAATERQWQALFGEWLRFAPVAYPALPVDAVATELLRLRRAQLQHLSRGLE